MKLSIVADVSEFAVSQNKNALNFNAIYDIQNKIYVDVIAENVKDCDVQSTLTQMIDRSKIKSANIIRHRT